MHFGRARYFVMSVISSLVSAFSEPRKSHVSETCRTSQSNDIRLVAMARPSRHAEIDEGDTFVALAVSLTVSLSCFILEQIRQPRWSSICLILGFLLSCW